MSAASTQSASLQSHSSHPTQTARGYFSSKCAQNLSTTRSSTSAGNRRTRTFSQPETPREAGLKVADASCFEATTTLSENCLEIMPNMVNRFESNSCWINSLQASKKLTSTCFEKAATYSTSLFKTRATSDAESFGTTKKRWERTRTFFYSGRLEGNLPVVFVTFLLCLTQQVANVCGSSVAGNLFHMGHGAMMFGHGLDSGFSDNSSMPCPGSCVCTDGGLRVDCSGQNLTQVPREIPSGTTHLDLSMNNISTLPETAFAHLTSLQDLRLASNKLKRLPRKIFRKNRFLSTLYLQGNKFQSVPRGALQNLPQLQQLHLDANQIRDVPANCFRNLHSLKQLWLDYNNLTKVPTRALASLSNLEALTLALNNITVIPKHAFRNLSRLVVLLLHDNRITEIKDFAFDGLKSLRILELNKNRLKQMPSSLSHLESLMELNLEQNAIEALPDNCFSRNRKLTLIQLHKNPIRSIGTRVFTHLPSLEKIVLSEVTNMFTFPDLNGTNNLTQIRLDRASIQVVPPGICNHRPWLKSFDIHSNKITMIPDLSSCSMLLNLNLGNNQLLTLEGKPFRGLSQLRDLTLNHNKFNHIPADAFVGLNKLQYLDLAHNQIKTIHPSAFLPLSSLEDLNLGDNEIVALPTQGLQSLQKLKTFDNENLRDFPPKEAFPKVYNLVLNYAYHCCDFLQSASIPTDTVEMVDEKVTWLGNKDGAADMWQEHYYNLTAFWTTHFDNHTPELWEDIQNNQYDPAEYDFSREAEIYLEDYETGHGDVYVKNLVVAKPPVTCKPKPGPFMPCDDLFGWWSLRCGVWFVFMLALLGNAVVLFVSVSSRSKMDVPRFLICNLACADFCMGVYLGILAMVDASTLGEFRKHAIQWQISGGCLVAGFLGVLSSELSVFTLTVITLERFYAITHAMQLNKRLSLRQAGYVMLGGWLWSSTLASLPLFGVSDYRKFAICLPFEVEDLISKSYVCFILVFNGVSFCIILACYLCMYLSIRHSQAWNSNDTRVAKRMALLVFTDFLCWAPIAFFSLGASFGKNLIDLSGAKVLTIFVLPLNSCANPFLYAIFTKQFKRDCVLLCRRLEDSSIARHFSRVSNRHVSLTWGSSRRPSQLHSLVNGEKGGSCSRSMSAASGFGNGVGVGGGGGGGGVAYHSDPDSGKGSLDYEKVPSGDTPTAHEVCNCRDNKQGDAEDGHVTDYESTNAYNELLTRCTVENTEGDTCTWQCRDCHVIMHQHQQQQQQQQQQHQGRAAYSPSGGGGGGGGLTARIGSDDYNCTTETYLPNSDVDHHEHQDHRRGGGGGSGGCQRQRQHQHRSTSHQTGGNLGGGGGGGGGSRSRKDREESCRKAGCECAKDKSQRSGEKRSRKDLIMPIVSFSKAGTERVDIHSHHSGGGPASTISSSADAAAAALAAGSGHCCRGGSRGGGGGGDGGGCLGGALRCCHSANSSPVENERHHHHHHRHHHHHHGHNHHRGPRAAESPRKTPPPPSSTSSDGPPASRVVAAALADPRLTSSPRCRGDAGSHACDVKRDDVTAKPDDGDSGHGVGGDGGSAGGREGSSTDEGVAAVVGVAAGSVEMGDGGGGGGGGSGGEGPEANRGDSLGGGPGRGPGPTGGCRKTPHQGAPPTAAVCRRVLDKSEHMRFFTDSLAAHPHACRSNSLVELTQTSQAKLTAHLHPNSAAKRLSLTPRQEGYLLLSATADDNSPYLDDDEDPEFPPYEELQRYLHASKQCKGRAHALDRSAAPRDEVCGLLEAGNSCSPYHTQDGTRGQDGAKGSCSTYDKESGFSSEY